VVWHTVGPLAPIEHHLNTTAYLSIVTDNAHPFMNMTTMNHILMATSSKITLHVFSNSQIISVWFSEHASEFTIIKYPPHSPDLSPIEQLWDVNEWEIHIRDEQMIHLQQLCDAIMSIWTKPSEEHFQHVVESIQ